MATPTFVKKQVQVLVAAKQLSLSCSEEQLAEAVASAVNGWTPARDVKIPWPTSDKVYTHHARRRIFPEMVRKPDSSGNGWVDDHRWGEGSNERGQDILLYLKEEVVRLAGLPLDRCAWRFARQIGIAPLQRIFTVLQTDMGRGRCSPYTQDAEKELELAVAFGPEALMRWHATMHPKGWAEFIVDIHALWKRWGTQPIWALERECEKNFRWFAKFASERVWAEHKQESLLPENADWGQAVGLWKRSRYYRAAAKVESASLAHLDAKYGQSRVDWLFQFCENKINALPDELRSAGMSCLMEGDDSVEWLPDFFKLVLGESAHELEKFVTAAKAAEMYPSVFSQEVMVIMKATSMRWETISNCLNQNKVSFGSLKKAVREHTATLSQISEARKSRAIWCLLSGDSVEWLKKQGMDYSEPEWVCNQSIKLKLQPSKVAAAIQPYPFYAIRHLVEKVGYYTATTWIREFASEFKGVREDLLYYAVWLHRSGDDISWLNAVPVGNAFKLEDIVRWSSEDSRKASELGPEALAVETTTGLTWRDVQRLRETVAWKQILTVCEQFHSQIASVISDRREMAVELLVAKSTRNTNWWPQAIKDMEFDAGVAAEKLGREGLEGIQRMRWLQSHLGLVSIPKVDEKISWERSAEIIRQNPWLATSLEFVDRQKVILDISKNRDVTYLKYVATKEEMSAAKERSGKLGAVWQVIKSVWSDDVCQWFEKLATAVGEEIAWNYVGNRSRHDQLYFVEQMLQKLPVEFLKTALLQVRGDLERFGQAVNAFEPDGTTFQSLKEFTKFVDLQAGQIVFPVGGPDCLRPKVEEMLEAPGLSVSAVREFIRNRENWPFIEGKLDSQAVFPAMRLEFTVEPLPSIVTRALGKRNPKSQEEHAQAERPELLFKRLNEVVKKAGLKLKGGAAGLTQSVPADIDQEVIGLLREHKVKLGDVFVAEVLPKSDPRGWVCGDWTSCCMQFGSDKNNEYMRRRDMAYFVVSLNDRLIAQSVVVAGADIGKNGTAPKPATAQLADLDAIALDNVEVAPNYTVHNSVIELLYKEFWPRYVAAQKVSSHVIIGKSHNDALPTKDVTPMAWKPLEPMVWSDCFGNSQAYLLVTPAPRKENQHDLHRAA